MNKLGVVAFCGAKGSGKNTSSDIFKELVGMPTEELAMADTLKKVCAEVFEVPMENFLNQSLKEKELLDYIVIEASDIERILKGFGFTHEDYTYDGHIRMHVGKVIETPRKLLQYVGTEVLHRLDPLIHIKKVFEQASDDKLTLITDLRFPQEFDAFAEKYETNFLPVYVQNNAAEAAAERDQHASERGLFVFKDKCYKVENNTTLGDLRDQLRIFVAEKVKV